MKDVGPGKSLPDFGLPSPTDHPRRRPRRPAQEIDQTKTTPSIPLQSDARSADAPSPDFRAPAAGGLEIERQPTTVADGDENRSTGAKTNVGSREGSATTGSCDPVSASHLSHQEEPLWIWGTLAPNDASCTPGESGELSPSCAACTRSRPVDPSSAGIDRSIRKDREGLVSLHSHENGD